MQTLFFDTIAFSCSIIKQSLFLLSCLLLLSILVNNNNVNAQNQHQKSLQKQNLPSSRTLYSNDGHSSSSHSDTSSSNSWEDLDGGIFPQRNQDFPEPIFSQFLPSIQRPSKRVALPAISAELPALEWLVSGNWVENVGSFFFYRLIYERKCRFIQLFFVLLPSNISSCSFFCNY